MRHLRSPTTRRRSLVEDCNRRRDAVPVTELGARRPLPDSVPQQRADAGTPARAAAACSPAVPGGTLSPVFARRRVVRAGYVTLEHTEPALAHAPRHMPRVRPTPRTLTS